MRLPVFLSLLLVAVALAACDTTEESEPAVDPVLPLAVGNTWVLERTYQIRYATHDGETTADTITSPLAHPRRDTLGITRDTLINGERWFFLEPITERQWHRFPHFVLGSPQWIAHREEGLYRYRYDNVPELLYATDTAPGEPFVDTRAVVATLLDPAATYTLPERGPVDARAYQRTFRYVEYNHPGQKPPPPEGPVNPVQEATDHLSPELGIVALDVPYVTHREEEGWIPAQMDHWELVSFEQF